MVQLSLRLTFLPFMVLLSFFFLFSSGVFASSFSVFPPVTQEESPGQGSPGGSLKGTGLEGGIHFGIRVPVAGNPKGVVLADFNGDGHLDMATSCMASHCVSVALGRGDGSFGGSVNFSVGKGPGPIGTGDFTNDGHVDIVTANRYTGTVTVLPGDGNGAFGDPVHSLAGPFPEALEVMDFDADGTLDLAVCHELAMDIMFGAGDGTFKSRDRWTLEGDIQYVDSGDLDKDGFPDVIHVNRVMDVGLSYVTVLLNDGEGSFWAAYGYEFVQVPGGIRIGDLNGDTNLDFVVTLWGTGRVALHLGLGNGLFQIPVYDRAGTWMGPGPVAIGDLTGDAVPDLAVVHQREGLLILAGKGDGRFEEPLHHLRVVASDVSVGDLDQDGTMDPVVSHGGTRDPALTAAVLRPLAPRPGTQGVVPTFSWTGRYQNHLFCMLFPYEIEWLIFKFKVFIPVALWQEAPSFEMPETWWDLMADEEPCYWLVVGADASKAFKEISVIWRVTKD